MAFQFLGGFPPLEQASAGNRAGPGQPVPSPSCFVPNEFGPVKSKKLLDHVVPARSVKARP